MPIPNYQRIDPAIIAGLNRYLEYGTQPGHFLMAVLENNLVEAFSRADENNCNNMFHLAAYLYNKVNPDAWGSPEKVARWRAARQEERRRQYSQPIQDGVEGTD